MLTDHRHTANCPWQWFAPCRCHLAEERDRIVQDVSEAFAADLRRLRKDHARCSPSP